MNKKAIALALVLVIAMSGVFALDLNTVDDVTATLKATVGDYLDHGFIESSSPGVYAATKTIENAFTTDPVFTYGYKTNMDVVTTPIKFEMSVGDFILQSNTDIRIKIGDVMVGTSSPAPTSGVYTLLTSAQSGLQGQAIVTIKPMKADGDDHLGYDISDDDSITDTLQYVNDDAAPGEYISTVTISVATVS
ncbi:hypothetical protein [uncultured Sphaerochaeta sp.]|uniref:hypothetical protein n=1 Tax=uncultured Sphaerochaeta sp. TaxID=886478 RepID=UPI002A0A809D|nr:hypothetical protein [uncultured Sphaerochaeta sp.]